MDRTEAERLIDDAQILTSCAELLEAGPGPAGQDDLARVLETRACNTLELCAPRPTLALRRHKLRRAAEEARRRPRQAAREVREVLRLMGPDYRQAHAHLDNLALGGEFARRVAMSFGGRVRVAE